MSSNCVNRLNKVLKTLDEKNISKVAFDAFKGNTPIGDPNRWKSRKAPKNYKPGNLLALRYHAIQSCVLRYQVYNS